MLLRINLLPENERKVTLSPIEQLHRTPLMWLIVGCMVLIVLLVLVPVLFRQQQLRHLTANIAQLEPRKQEVEQLQRYLSELRTQESAFQSLGKGQGSWSQRLNILSDVSPEGVWFTELSLDRVKGLVIQGSAVGSSGTDMDNVGRLARDLKASPIFTEAVQDVQIESIKRVQERDIEIVQFTLSCTLNEGSAL